MKSGEIKHEMEVNVGSSVAWELYGTLKLGELVERRLSEVISKVEVVEGDGGVGTVIALTFSAGPITGFKERFTKVDNHKRLKETEVIEGGYLDLGFSSYRVTLQVIDKDPGRSCLITSTIRYELSTQHPDSAAAAEALVSIDALAAIAAVAKDHLTDALL